MEIKEHTHLGVYGIIIRNGKIVLIKKAKGPYKGKLDLPGGSFEFGEKPEETLKREILEETYLNVLEYILLCTDSVLLDWENGDELIKVHHIGIFYEIINYDGNVKNIIELNYKNDDSYGADFYEISKLDKCKISKITELILKKLK